MPPAAAAFWPNVFICETIKQQNQLFIFAYSCWLLMPLFANLTRPPFNQQLWPNKVKGFLFGLACFLFPPHFLQLFRGL